MNRPVMNRPQDEPTVLNRPMMKRPGIINGVVALMAAGDNLPNFWAAGKLSKKSSCSKVFIHKSKIGIKMQKYHFL